MKPFSDVWRLEGINLQELHWNQLEQQINLQHSDPSIFMDFY